MLINGKNHETLDRESGFTLLELTIALAVISALAGGWYQWKQSVLRESIAQRTADGIVLIEEALYSYRLDERKPPKNKKYPYEWPLILNDLDPYLPGIAGGRNGVGQSYSLILPPATRTAPIKIKTDLLTAQRAKDVKRLFPVNGKIGSEIIPPLADTWVVVTVPVPGHEAAREALLARDGAKEMTDDLDMGNNNIKNVADEIMIGGQPLNTDNVDLLNQMSALNCPNAVQINAGTATCAPAANIQGKTETGSYNTAFAPIAGFSATQCSLVSFRDITSQTPPYSCTGLGLCGCGYPACPPPIKAIAGLSVAHKVVTYIGQQSGCKANPQCITRFVNLSGTVSVTMQCVKP